ncbi:MAG: hypothetical protein IJ681_09570 [Bacteroidales bacterium]|nr:hypothetical protein [Bacteroidales bacterium]
MKKLFIGLLFCLTVVSCQDDFDEWGYVNFYIEPDTTEYQNLNDGTRQWEYFEGGNRGVIIVRNSHYEFMAYERSCVVKGCKGRLEMDKNTNVIIYCPDCKSQWISVDGSPLVSSGSKTNHTRLQTKANKAVRMLYAYCAYYDGWRLYVRNCANN